MILGELMGAVLVLGAVYCLGGMSGIWLAFTNEARFRVYASKVSDLHLQMVDLEKKGSTK